MSLHLFEFAVSSWLAYYASRVFCTGVEMYLVLWAAFFGILFFVDWLTAES